MTEITSKVGQIGEKLVVESVVSGAEFRALLTHKRAFYLAAAWIASTFSNETIETISSGLLELARKQLSKESQERLKRVNEALKTLAMTVTDGEVRECAKMALESAAEESQERLKEAAQTREGVSL